MSNKKEPNWTPVLRGAIYCSPSCGCGCTKAAYDEATRLGNALAARMGKGWEADIWENCHWHYAVNLKTENVLIRLHHGNPEGRAREPHREGVDEYSAYVQTSPQFIRSHTDPKEAVRLALAALDEHVSGLRRALCDGMAAV